MNNDQLKVAIARAIWDIRREEEDRCDMELEDMGRNHSVWREADAVIATLTAAQSGNERELPRPIDRKFLADNLALLAKRPKEGIRGFGEEWAADLASDALRLLGEYDDVLRGIAFTLAAGGYNSEGLIDPKVADDKIRWGIDHILAVEKNRTSRPAPEREQQEAGKDAQDTARLDWLIRNEAQVWEVNRRYSIHEVTEHHAVTAEYMTPRAAIDAAMKASTAQAEQSKGGEG